MDKQIADPCTEEMLEPYAAKFKAIGHPIRLKILCLIAHQEVPCVGDLWRCLNQPQPVVSQHLAILKKSGIVSSEVNKTKRVYSIVDPFIKSLVDSIICNVKPRSDTAPDDVDDEKQLPTSPV
ncbi:MAG TPA: metalloregulator ArsR/SmtB family transcription factor [Spirochaetales bacterium]|nr:metalloregulator ArsR/SmtB family transcription factor [Spirochaetales bacterium]